VTRQSSCEHGSALATPSVISGERKNLGLQKPQTFVVFGIAGRRDEVLNRLRDGGLKGLVSRDDAMRLIKKEQNDEKSIIIWKIKKNNVSLHRIKSIVFHD
jgi:hypothetical protein